MFSRYLPAALSTQSYSRSIGILPFAAFRLMTLLYRLILYPGTDGGRSVLYCRTICTLAFGGAFQFRSPRMCVTCTSGTVEPS